MKRATAVLAGVIGLLATACYQDFDFTADHKADYVVVGANGSWRNLGTGAVFLSPAATDWPVPGDWNGDHFMDAAVVTPNGDWVTGVAATFSFPKPPALPGPPDQRSLTSLPVPGDYDGDGTTDAAWYDESNGTWHIRGRAPVVFGTGPSTPGASDYDFPVPADYDGDAITDLSTFNPATQLWKVKESSTGSVTALAMPGNELLPMPVPADYDGVGHAQRAVMGSNGWFIEGHAAPDPFGAWTPTTDSGYPAVADYDGDDRADPSFVEWDGGIWRTKGCDVTFDLGDGYMTKMPLATGRNLRWNIARITYQGFCNTDSGYCD